MSEHIGLTPEEESLLDGGQKIRAIKSIIARTHCGVKAAKDVADAYQDRRNGHIRVALDFVPVEERLPEGEPNVEIKYPVLFNGTELGMAWLSELDDGEVGWEIRDVALGDELVTHWAEIPVIER